MADSTASLDCDFVVICLERSPDLSCYMDPAGTSPFKISKNGLAEADKSTMQTSLPHVFAGGELRQGRSVVMEAVADGRRAARSIHFMITEGEVRRFDAPPQERIIPESILKDMRVTYSIPRVVVPELPLDVRKHSMTMEVTRAITYRDALKEASRCLRCGLTCYDRDAGSAFSGDSDVTRFNASAAKGAKTDPPAAAPSRKEVRA